MIMLLLFALLLIGVIIVVIKKVSNKLLRFFLIAIFSALAMGILWVIWMAAKSGEM